MKWIILIAGCALLFSAFMRIPKPRTWPKVRDAMIRGAVGLFVGLIGLSMIFPVEPETEAASPAQVVDDGSPQESEVAADILQESPAVLFLQAAIAGEIEPNAILEGTTRVARTYRDLPEDVRAETVEIYSLPDHPDAYNFRLFTVRIPIAHFLGLTLTEPTSDPIYEYVEGPLGPGLLQRNRTSGGTYYSFRTVEYVINGQPELVRLLPPLSGL